MAATLCINGTAGKYSTASIYGTAGTYAMPDTYGKAGTFSTTSMAKLVHAVYLIHIIIYTVRVIVFKGLNFHDLRI